ncbi:MAG: cell division protein [Candidatus Amoebophilus sp. 36-38]|nr:MAG: cell division protein [Candidatus Amoebophilus sp. 36-38]
MKEYADRPKSQLGSFPITNVIFSTMLALFVMGLFGLLLIHATKLTKTVQENVTIQVYLNKNITESDVVRIDQALSQQAFILKKNGIPQLAFISKKEAAENLIKETGENFIEILQENPLRDSYILHIDPAYQDADQLHHIKKEISDIEGIFEVCYVENVVSAINKNLRQVSIILIFFTIILLLAVIILINNTIRLALYSQRFLIRSMNLVGATASFIRKPFLVRAILIGLLAGTIADVILLSLLHYVNLQIDSLLALQQPIKIFILLAFIPLLGVCITFTGTYRAINKYLHLSLENLH